VREAEAGLANGKTVAQVSRELGISEQTYYRWRKEFGGMTGRSGITGVIGERFGLPPRAC
jgi:transposase-like protein